VQMKRIPEEDIQHILNHTARLWEAMRGKSIFITGGTGFFGKWLLETFSYAIREMSLNTVVYILSRNPEAFTTRFPHLANESHFKFLKGDVTDFSFPELDIDLIIHAATEASAKLNHEDPLLMIDSIIQGTRNVLDFARTRNVGRVLYISSGAVYGIQPDGLKGFPEDFPGGPDPLQPSSAYAEAKRTAELLCACYSRQYHIEIPVARCFAFVGPYLDLDAHFAIGNFIKNGLNQENIVIRGDGKPMRSYLYAADLVIWLLHILLLGKPGEAYNVGSDQAISIKDLALKVAGFFPGLKVEVLNQVQPTDRNQNYVPDIHQTMNIFSLTPPLGLDESISRTINFFK
jgi:nucleoside-diphosphate-sugar epimerase